VRFRTASLALFVLVGCHRRLFPDMQPVPVDSPLTSEQLAEGKKLYRSDCADCHGKDGKGGGREAARLPAKPTDLTTLATRHGGVFPREYVIRVVAGEEPFAAHERSGMPIWNRRYGPADAGPAAVASLYVQRNLELLVGYLRTLQHPATRHPAR